MESAPTLVEVVRILQAAPLRRAHLANEATVRRVLTTALRAAFVNVGHEYFVGGYWGMRADIDIGNGHIGVEVKLADTLQSAANVQRLFGQAVYYSRRCYADQLIVLVAGTTAASRRPEMQEVAAFLKSLGVTYVCITTP